MFVYSKCDIVGSCVWQVCCSSRSQTLRCGATCTVEAWSANNWKTFARGNGLFQVKFQNVPKVFKDNHENQSQVSISEHIYLYFKVYWTVLPVIQNVSHTSTPSPHTSQSKTRDTRHSKRIRYILSLVWINYRSRRGWIGNLISRTLKQLVTTFYQSLQHKTNLRSQGIY